jgi:hypothetical protein
MERKVKNKLLVKRLLKFLEQEIQLMLPKIMGLVKPELQAALRL